MPTYICGISIDIHNDATMHAWYCLSVTLLAIHGYIYIYIHVVSIYCRVACITDVCSVVIYFTSWALDVHTSVYQCITVL